MTELENLGLHPGWIYEVLVTTYAGGRPHAAPMGVRTEDLETLELDVYQTSRTLREILAQGEFVANVPADVTQIHDALYHPDRLSYEGAIRARAPLIRGCPAGIELRLRSTSARSSQTRLTAEVLRTWSTAPFRLLNRAEPLLLESLVATTKPGAAEDPEVRERLDENLRVVSKVAPRSRFQSAMEQLLRDL